MNTILALMIVVYLVLQYLDVTTTNELLDRGGRELNPWLIKLMKWGGRYWGFLKIVIHGFLPLTVLPFIGDVYKLILMSLLIALYAFVVGHNIYELHKK